MQLRWCGLLLLLLLLLLVEGISAQDDDFSDKCCKLGTSWASQKLSCSKFTGPVAGVGKAHQTACLESVDSCCREASHRQECDLGKADAKAGRACEKSKKAPPGLAQVRSDCCEGCKLGIESGRNKSCGKKAIFSESWGSAFTECCEEKLTTGTTRAATSTTKIAKTTSTTVTTEDDELAELFKDITDDPTFSTQGDLCQLMKGLLCSDICVPTPGSYYCKCRDGSALQPDGRSCESPTTTTKKATKTITKRMTAKSTPKITTTKSTTKSTPKSTTTKAPPKTTTTKAPPKTTTTKAPPKTTTTKAPPKTTTTKAPPKSTTTKAPPKTTTTKAPPKTTTTKAPPKTTTTKAPPKTTAKAPPKTTAKAPPKTTTTKAPAKSTTTSAPKTTKVAKKATDPMSPLTALKLLTKGAKTRTTRALTTEENELNQSCPPGYRLNPKSTTCDDTPCLNNDNDSYDCVPICEFGYRWNATLGRCDDVDECAENSHKCIAETEICRNLVGSFECEVKCEEGFVFNSFYAACLDWNECSDHQGTNPCPQDTICVNTLGSYECKSLVDYNVEPRLPAARNFSADYDGIAEEGRDNNVCAYGFTYNSDTKSCDDIDECEILLQPCAQDEVCRNTVGGYDCVPAGCHRGFARRDNATEACVDVDECADESLHSCLPGEICRNTNGSFTCEPPRPTMRPSLPERPAIVCRKGYKADYELDGCVDIDECTEGPGCRDHERCVNFQGTYDCSPLCGLGWYFDMESKTCQDVDECMLGHHNCRQRTQYCRNTKGSYTCEPLEVCASGYRRSPHNGSCVDVDECHEGTHSCSRLSHRYCVNREGGYECITRLPACSPGFEYSLLTHDCRDEDECRNGKATCDPRLNERCVNLPGTYRCERTVPALRRVLRPACPSGTRYDAKLRMCADIDECEEGTHDCGREKCYNLPGSFECAKAVLPVIKRRTTTTVEMGSRSNGDDNCSAGSKYDSERGGCVDIDECREIKDACGSYEDCVNTAGSFECRCKLGFRRENLTQACVDVNECLQDNDCLSYQRCDNTIGSYACVRFLSCGTGYTLNAATEVCEDDDECLMGTHNCPKGWNCLNTLGNFRCIKDRKTPGERIRTTTWPSRWTTKSPPRIPITPRTTTAAPWTPPTTTTQQTTTTTTYRPTTTTTTTTTTQRTTTPPTSTTTTSTTTQRPTTTTPRRIWTTARPPWENTYRPWNTTYRPWNTTLRPPAWESSTYRPRSTTYRPNSTPRYYMNSTAYVPPTRARFTTTTTTEFIPTVGPIVTSRNWAWTTARSPTCPPGYESGSSGQCIDVNECQRNPRVCGPFKCINSMGSYKCERQAVCPVGYRADPATGECRDMDECALGHECGPYQKCQNKPGGYYCYCPQGYEIRGKECIDANECARFPGICGVHGRCENTVGSYRCSCEAGFQTDPTTGACVDLDECVSRPNLCEHQCYNTWGGHRCGCHYGYKLRGDNRTCEDIDECQQFKDNHLCVGFCENTPGSYACRCPDGYRIAEDGRTCQDIDECATSAVCQGPHEICQNVRGSYRCNKINCPSGYTQDPQRKNRCMRESPFCPAHDAACFNRPAHYTYNYIAIVSMFPMPPSGEVELFVMRGAYNVPGSTVSFSMSFITARTSPGVQSATEECFALNKHYPSQAVLAMTKSLQGPQDIELELLMEIYSPNGIFAGSAVAKIFIVITQYEF